MSRASQLYKQLNGLIAIYKTSETNIMEFGLNLKRKLCSEFNKIPWEPSPMTKQLSMNPATKQLVVTTQPDLVDSSLVLGNRFEVDDFEMYVSDPMAEISSGVQIFGIGPAGLGDLGPRFETAQLMKVYRVKCMLGRSTKDGTPNTNTVTRTTWLLSSENFVTITCTVRPQVLELSWADITVVYTHILPVTINLIATRLSDHVTQPKLERILAFIESSYQRRLFSLAGILPNSSKAYNLLASGSLIRPLPRPDIPVEKSIEATGGVALPDSPPMIYAVKCVDWDPPFFTLELHMINESMDFLVGLIEDIGVELKSSALVTQIRRLRHGRINAEDCLLIRECTVDSVINQIGDIEKLHPSESLYYMRDKFTPVHKSCGPGVEDSHLSLHTVSSLDTD